MGLLEQRKEIEAALVYRENGQQLAWVNDDGSLHFDNAKAETIEQCINICKWYLNVAGQL